MLAILRKFLTSILGARKPLDSELMQDRDDTAHSRDHELFDQMREAAGAQLVPYDEFMLDRARTQWQFGDWANLTSIDRDSVMHHPDRAKIALLVASGHMQTGNTGAGRAFVRMAKDWGCSEKLIAQVLCGGVHQSLGRAALISGDQKVALQHFQVAVSIGTPGSDARLLARARLDQQLHSNDRRIEANAVAGTGHEQSTQEPVRLDDSGSAASPPSGSSKRRQEFSSARYWDDRYRSGRHSGAGSYGRLAEFKAEVINNFVAEHDIKSVIEFGCGDGNQLAKFTVQRYIGVDVSEYIVDQCRGRFRGDAGKTFLTVEEFQAAPCEADLTLSLDVLYHLIEEDVFSAYLNNLFSAATKYVIIYSCNEERVDSDSVHVRRRKFVDWIAENKKSWRLSQIVYNKYPHDGSKNPDDTSFSDFYIFVMMP